MGVAQDIIQSLTWRTGRHNSQNNCLSDKTLTKMSCQYFFNVFWPGNTETSLVNYHSRLWSVKCPYELFNSTLFPFLVYNTIHLCKILQEFSGKTSRHLTKSSSSSWLLCLNGDQYGRCLKCLTAPTGLYYFYVLKGEKEKSAATTN